MKLSKLLRSLLSRFTRIHVGEPGEGDPADLPETPPAGDDTGNPEDAAGDGSDTPAAKGAPADDRDRLIKKLERRIDNRTKGLGQRDQTIAQMQAEIDRLRAGGAAQPRTQQRASNEPLDEEDEPSDVVPASEVPRLVRSQVDEERFRERIADSTTKMLAAGKVYEGFRELVLDVAEDIPLVDRRGRPTHFAEALLECDAPADVVVHIQRNDDLRDEVAALADNPRKLARKLALIEVEVRKKPPTRSKAATPLEPNKGGSSSGSKTDSEMTDAEWAAAQEAKRKKRA